MFFCTAKNWRKTCVKNAERLAGFMTKQMSVLKLLLDFLFQLLSIINPFLLLLKSFLEEFSYFILRIITVPRKIFCYFDWHIFFLFQNQICSFNWRSSDWKRSRRYRHFVPLKKPISYFKKFLSFLNKINPLNCV